MWSIGVRYGGVLNVLDRYRRLRRSDGHHAESDTPKDLVDVIEVGGGPAAFAELVSNRQRTSPRNGILKAEAVLLVSRQLVEADVRSPIDLAALSQQRLAVLRTKWTAVPGQRSGLSWDYFLMLSGLAGVKADRMVRRFVAEALGLDGEQSVSQSRAATAVTEAANKLGLDPRVVDYAIWRRLSGQ